MVTILSEEKLEDRCAEITVASLVNHLPTGSGRSSVSISSIGLINAIVMKSYLTINKIHVRIKTFISFQMFHQYTY